MKRWFVMFQLDVCRFQVYGGKPRSASGYSDHVLGNRGFKTKKEAEKVAKEIKKLVQVKK